MNTPAPLLPPQAFSATVLRVRDLDTSIRWYERVLGVSIRVGADGSHRTASFQLANSYVSLWELAAEEEGPRGSLSDPYVVVVVTGGLEGLRETVARRGAAPSRIHCSTRFDLFRIRDPDRNLLEVSQLRAEWNRRFAYVSTIRVIWAMDIAGIPEHELLALMEAGFKGVPLHEFIQLKPISLQDAVCLEMPVSENVRGFAGGVHGGALATAVDVASSIAAALSSRFDLAQNRLVTVDLSLRYFLPSKSGPIRIYAERSQEGRRLIRVDTTVRDGDENLMATGQALMMILEGPYS